MKNISDLKFWLRLALPIVPIAYAVNFIFAVATMDSGGTFGDSFGAANALFSGTALLMLVLAVILQREELEQVKEERNDTRKLLQGQEAINLAQEKALAKQSFEQSFFSLIQLISAERRALDRSIGNNASRTIISVSAGATRSWFANTESLSNFPLNDHTTECGTVSRLIIAAHGLLVDQGFEPQESLVYISTLHALLDADFAHVFCTLGHRWFENDPRVVPALIDLQIKDFIDEKWQDMVGVWLMSADQV